MMLVCDICDKGYHTYCLKPKLDDIPHNGWSCHVSFLLEKNLKKCFFFSFYKGSSVYKDFKVVSH